MAISYLESNNQEEKNNNKSEVRLRERRDVTFNSPCSSGAIFDLPHPGGDLAQEMVEDETDDNSVPVVPSGHRSASTLAPVKARKADKGSEDKERVNNNSNNSKNDVREFLFNGWMCSCCLGAASEDGPDC